MTKPCCCLGAWLLLVAICCCIPWKANAQVFNETDPPQPGYGTHLKQEIAFQLWESIERIPDERVFTVDLPSWHRPAVNLIPTTGGGSASHMNVSMRLLGGTTLVGSQMKANLAELFIAAVQRYCHPSVSLAVTLQIRVWLALPQLVASFQAQQSPSANTQPNLVSASLPQPPLSNPVQAIPQLPLQTPSPFQSQLQNHPSFRNPSMNGLGQRTSFQVQRPQTISQSDTATIQNAYTRLQVSRAIGALVRHVQFRFQDFTAQGNGVELKYTAY